MHLKTFKEVKMVARSPPGIRAKIFLFFYFFINLFPFNAAASFDLRAQRRCLQPRIHYHSAVGGYRSLPSSLS